MTTCGQTPGLTNDEHDARQAELDAVSGQYAERRVVYERWDMLVRARALEVNHIEPILGRHGVNGCHHHLDGLETLCHTCHVATTREQFGHKRHQNEVLDLDGAA